MIRIIKIVVAVVFVVIIQISELTLASEYLNSFQGNAELKLAGKENEFFDYFNSGIDEKYRVSQQETDEILRDVLGVSEINYDDYVYQIGDEEAYFMTNVLNGEVAPMANIEFGRNCSKKIYKNGIEYEAEEIYGDIGLINLYEDGVYTILVSSNSIESFYDNYVRYEIEVSGFLQLSEVNDKKEMSVDCFFDEQSKMIIYQYGNIELVRTNIPFGMAVNKEVIIETPISSDRVRQIYRDGSPIEFDVTGKGQSKYSDLGNYIIEVRAGEDYSDIKIFRFNWSIVEEMLCLNDDFFTIPFGVDVAAFKQDGKSIKVPFVNNRVVRINKNAIYEITYSIDDKILPERQMINKRQKKHLIELDKKISRRIINNKVEIKKMYDDISIRLLYDGSEILSKEILDKNGSYYVEAKDAMGNIESVYFKIVGTFRYLRELAILFIVSIGVIIFQVVKSNY